MKTLREYIDQLDEISRRDFLKGTGAAAAGAVLGTPKDAEAQWRDPYKVVDKMYDREEFISDNYSTDGTAILSVRAVPKHNELTLVLVATNGKVFNRPRTSAQGKIRFDSGRIIPIEFVFPKNRNAVMIWPAIDHRTGQSIVPGVPGTKALAVLAYEAKKRILIDASDIFDEGVLEFPIDKLNEESQLEETAAESDVDRVIQLSREMR